MHARFSPLWRDGDFLKLWTGQTISLFGTLVGRFALPMLAVFALGATPFQMSMLRVADMLPVLIVGLAAGVWVDRLRRRPMMVWADLGRALLLTTVPLVAFLGRLSIEYLVVIALAVGVLSTFFDVAYRSYLPALVRREELVEANAKLSASGSVVEVAGFGLAGTLVQIVGAPIVVLIDALSFVGSAISLALIRAPEPPPSLPEARKPLLREAREGLRLIAGDPILRAFALASATDQLFVHIWVTVLILFLIQDLAISPWLMGVLFAIGGVTSLLGALIAAPVVRRWGIGPTIIGCWFLGSASIVLVPLAGGPLAIVILCVGGQQLFDAAHTIVEINRNSLVQAITPARALGRVNASLYVTGFTAMLAGTLIGGVLGEAIGLRQTMLVGALGAMPSALWLLFSPLRALRTLREPAALLVSVPPADNTSAIP